MIVVTGATGNVGRPLVRELAAAGAKVTAVARGITASDLPSGVTSARADLTRPDEFGPIVDGADSLFLFTPGDLRAADVQSVVDTARERGVASIVLLSSLGVASSRHPADLETAVTGSPLDWTVLQPGAFHSNTLQWAPGVRVDRRIRAPFADVGLPSVDPSDIAAVAAAALLDPDGHVGRTYELTGPASITPREQAAAISDALGVAIDLVEQSREQARSEMLDFMPGPVADRTLDILEDPTPHEQQVSDAVQHLLGRPPRSYAGWLSDNVAAFA